MILENTIIWTILIPIIGSIGILITGKIPNLRETVTLTTAVVLFLVVAGLTPAVMTGERPSLTLVELVPGLNINFTVEPLGMLFGLVASGLWIINSIYSIGYMRGHKEDNQTRFYFFFAIALASAIGVAFAGNMLTLFFCYEVLTLCTFPLVTHSGKPEAVKSGRIYLGILLGTSVGLQLIAIIWTWKATGTLDFTQGGILDGKVPAIGISILLFLYMYGIGKAALMPIHRWLPAAMVAPTPVSALLHAVAVVKAGVFTVLKVVIYIFGVDTLSGISEDNWLMYVAAFTLIASSCVAITKDNLKARLAYSTVSQLAYIVLGAALANGLGIMGGGMHIAMHAFGKITLFFCAGAIMVASHKTEISEMDGLGKVMPITFIAFFIGSLSVIGLPPMGGSWSKWYLMLSSAESGYIIFLIVFMASSLLNIAYLMPVVVRGFFADTKPSKNSHDDHSENVDFWQGLQIGTIREAPPFCLLAITLSSIGCIVLFIYADSIYQLLAPIAGLK
ncbi:MAG: proton-conducting transporter membrane subunit [Pseudomonadota bacterium]|nr:proton-conducting transporter membrane subunit [Pseudomonadota bacterium]